MRVLAQNACHNANCQHDECEANQAFRPVIKPLGQTHVEFEHRCASAATANARPRAYVMPKRKPLHQLRCTAVMST